MTYMLINNRIILYIFCLIFIITPGCTTKSVSDDQLAIAPAFLDIYKSVSKNDTFSFSNLNGRHKIFTITKMDSIIHNKKGWFINQLPYKLLRMSFKELGQDITPLKRPNLIFVNRDPIDNTNSICIEFNNFYSCIDNILPPLNSDTLSINHKKITNYYIFETTLELKHADGIKTLYVSPQKGFLGFRTLSGEVWINNKLE